MKNILITAFAAVVLVGCGNREASSNLMFAAGLGQIEKAKQAISDGANVNVRMGSGTLRGHTPLDIAIRNGHTKVANLIRENGGKTKKELDGS